MEKTAVGTIGAADEKVAVVEKQPQLAGEKRFMKVMVGVDDSDLSLYALKWILDHVFFSPSVELPTADVEEEEEEGAGSESSMIILVNVQQPFQPFIHPAGPVLYPTTTMIESVKKAQQENATAVLSRALQMCKDNKVKAETLILEGDPKDRMCQTAEEQQVDLVVVGNRGLGMIERAFLGSVSDYCAHHVSCPLLIVNHPDRKIRASSCNLVLHKLCLRLIYSNNATADNMFTVCVPKLMIQ